jgi:hypothetical protein
MRFLFYYYAGQIRNVNRDIFLYLAQNVFNRILIEGVLANVAVHFNCPRKWLASVFVIGPIGIKQIVD